MSLALLFACSGKDAISDVDPNTPGEEDSRCKGLATGEACGLKRVCIDGVCETERCGDGVQASEEACDDGNQNNEDGCTTECVSSVCGNGFINPYEVCDDGNTVDGDSCPATCRTPWCGDREVADGGVEVCDGPQVGVGGGEASYSCSADCSAKIPYACETCQLAKCSVLDAGDGRTFDAVTGCMVQLDDRFGANAFDEAEFLERCVNLLNCALRTRCGLDAASPGKGCYCGSTAEQDCMEQGPTNPPCQAEFEAAGESTDHQELFARLGDLKYAVGFATGLLDCYRDRCAATCTPP